MRYIPHTTDDCEEMLRIIGVEKIEDLFSSIPEELRRQAMPTLPPALSEPEVLEHLRTLSTKNSSCPPFLRFLGAGAYDHYIPSAVSHLLLRSEFYTAYTPYQPELSQGTLQAMFEFQTMICQLTQMDVANASLYDGASALAEAVLMAERAAKIRRVGMLHSVHPEYRQVVRTYLQQSDMEITEIPFLPTTGLYDPEAAEGFLSEGKGCLVVQSPNFFGSIEDLSTLASLVHKTDSLLISAVAEPLSLGILKPPGACRADIVVGEGQSLGIPLSFGGPGLGLFACREKFLRNMPGRIAGETLDTEGQRGFVITLATREQHIRRERATSNICTNESLCALSTVIYLSLLGKEGLRKLALLNLKKAHFAQREISSLKGYSQQFCSPFFNEFAIKCPMDASTIQQRLLEEEIIAGFAPGRFYSELKDVLLLCVTEQHSKKDILRLCQALEKAGN